MFSTVVENLPFNENRCGEYLLGLILLASPSATISYVMAKEMKENLNKIRPLQANLTLGKIYTKLSAMEPLEIEVKYFLEDIEPIREQLIKAGAESHGRFFESNICFDNAEEGLSLSDSVLRLRKDEKTTLTYKTKPDVDDLEFKVVKELEVEVSDFEMMLNILRALGFHQSQIYEKYRETFTIGDTKLCLDRMPFGDFIEIEGGKDEIRNLSQQIGMQWNRRILGNYRFLFGIIKERLFLSFSDITFDNFRKVKMDMKTFLPLFETGGINAISEIRH